RLNKENLTSFIQILVKKSKWRSEDHPNDPARGRAKADDITAVGIQMFMVEKPKVPVSDSMNGDRRANGHITQATVNTDTVISNPQNESLSGKSKILSPEGQVLVANSLPVVVDDQNGRARTRLRRTKLFLQEVLRKFQPT